MAEIFPGRYAAQTDEPFVVFLIGMRVNRLFALSSWIPVAKAMPPMLAELKRNPELGLLHFETLLYWRGVAVVQYWRSFELLHAYAHARDAAHLPAWAEFNRRVGGNGSVGIWHETYTVAPGQYETIYANMPRFGLGGAFGFQAASGRLETARSRINRGSAKEPKPPAEQGSHDNAG
ncbi:MAG: DUF4188 domain-containing protein [Terracidiphilus sp.]|jgi:hypothetical protein